jgi:uncharacterized Zn finger protein
MPKIRFIQVHCPHCGAEYRVRLEKIETRQPFECLECGGSVPVEQFVEVLKLVRQYSVIVIDLESAFTLEGDTAIPLPLRAPERARKLTTW